MVDRQAEVLVGYSAGVRRGEVVGLIGPPGAEPLLLALRRRVLKAGGEPLLLIRPKESPADLPDTQGLETADVAIYVLLAPERLGVQSVASERRLYRQPHPPRLGLLFRRLAQRQLRWTATLFSSGEVGNQPDPSPGEFRWWLRRACFLDRPDPVAQWQALGRRQARLIEALQRAAELHLQTSAGTDLRLRIAGRRWHNGAGQQNFPDGEVCVAPLEDATEGTVCFDCPALLEGHLVRGIRLRFRAGRVVEATAASNEAWLHTLLEEDEGTRILGEAALGCNYALGPFLCNPLLDEKIGGTFHLALGTSLPGSGGRNRSAWHADLIGDLRPGGRVEADRQLISVDGKFVDPRWPQPDK